MKMCLWFFGVVACFICLPEQKPIQARDYDQPERGITFRVLESEQAFYSQLRHTGRIGGPEFGWEIHAVEVKDGVLVSPTVIMFDSQGQADEWGTAETFRIKVAASRQLLLIKGTNTFVITKDGTMATFESESWELPLRYVKLP